jgi:hypothetical protein
MKQRCTHILLLLGLMPGMLAGLNAGKVLCIGADGQYAIEPASLGAQIRCVPTAGDAHAGGLPAPRPAGLSDYSGCGPCTDIPGGFSLPSSAHRGDNPSAQPMALLPAMILPITATAMCAGCPNPADTPPERPVPLLTTILLI